MKNFTLLLFLLGYYFLLCSNIVINEFLYDPIGSDSGNEWIEIYNPSSESVNISGWKLQKAGIVFEDIFSFPQDTIIAPNTFLLIGEDNVSDCEFYTVLGLQNGGSETDGLRLISQDELYTDTILYDSPNSNSLPDDISENGTTLFIDVTSGHTIARKINGNDTNKIDDLFDCSFPTPKTENIFPQDYAITCFNAKFFNEICTLYTEITNLSTDFVDNSEIFVDIYQNNVILTHFQIPAIYPQEVYNLEKSFTVKNSGIIEYRIEVNVENDFITENNTQTKSILIGPSPIIINEFMAKPSPTKPEWIELYNRNKDIINLDNFLFKDASGGIIHFSGVINPNDFVIISQFNTTSFTNDPNFDNEKNIIASSWTALNNSEDSILLYYKDCLLDSTFYNDDMCQNAISLERTNPISDDNIIFLPSISDFLSTPTYSNSVLLPDYDLKISGSLDISSTKLCHKLFIKNNGIYHLNNVQLTCNLYQKNVWISELLKKDINLTDSITYEFLTEKPSNGYYFYKFEISQPIDEINENNYYENTFSDNSYPIVINEIMYNPLENEPEWIELKNNCDIDIPNIYVVINSDTMIINNTNTFTLLTSSSEDSLFLRNLVNYDIPIFTGMPMLSNQGAGIYIHDKCNNKLDSLFYNPNWSAEKGVSIERILSDYPPNDDNFGPSKNQSTPGAENSLFISNIPTKSKFEIVPKTFSPYKNEHTLIKISLPEKLSRITCRIFDLKGREMIKLVNQEINSAEANFIWDGKNKEGSNLSIGIYVVLIEATSINSEKVYRKKDTVIIAK